MLTMLKDWKGSVEVNGTMYDTLQAFITTDAQLSDGFHIILHTGYKTTDKEPGNKVTDAKQKYRITVKPYMTKPATPEFDFMAKWNN